VVEDFRKFRRGYRFSTLRARNLVVLAEHAPQRTARKKDGAAAVFMGNARLLKRVQRVLCNPHLAIATAYACPFSSVCAARNRAQPAILFVVSEISHSKTIISQQIEKRKQIFS
jgi:hypothetical protein